MCTRAVSVRIAAVLISWKKVHKQTNITMYVIATYSSTAIFLMTLLIYCQEQQSFVLVMHLTLTGPSHRLYVQIHASNVQVHLYHSTIILRYSFAVSDTEWRDQTRKHASSISFTWRLTTVHVKCWHVLTWGQAVQTKTHLHTCTSLFAELTCLKC